MRAQRLTIAILVAVGLAFLAGHASADIQTSHVAPVHPGRIASNGTTPVAIVAGTAHKSTSVVGGTIRNEDSVAHTAILQDEDGNSLGAEFELAAAPSQATIDEDLNVQAPVGKGINLVLLDTAGVVTSVKAALTIVVR